MATTQRNSWRRQDDYRDGYAQNRGTEDYGNEDYDDYDNYTDTNYEDEEDRPFGRVANYNDYEDEYDLDDNFEGSYNRHEYAGSENRNRTRGDYWSPYGYKNTNRNGRTIEGENGGNESYNESEYSPRYNRNLNFGSYGNRTGNQNRRLNRDYGYGDNRSEYFGDRAYDNNYQSYSDNDFYNRPYTRRRYDGSLSLRRTDGRGYADTSRYRLRDEQ